MKDSEIGFQIKTAANLIRRRLEKTEAFCEQQSFTGTHGWVIGYLYDNRHRDVFQRDFESEFSIRRSSITKMLKSMEKNGLIERKSVENDARLKKIVLTERALKMQKRVSDGISKLEKEMAEGISPEELELFFKTLKKIKCNLEEKND